jgi:ubiquinone/menaquinone biosynthesis C-methylase UbiE
MRKKTIINKKAADISRFWEGKGLSDGSGKLVTHKDAYQVSIEIRTILQLLRASDELLDVGCGNGFATHVYAKKCRRVTGVDYAANMIESAREAYGGDNISFEQGDVLSVDFKKGSFSAAVSTRCLINLLGWESQKRAIMNIHRMLKKGGRYIFVEGIRQGRDNLNAVRNEMGLPSMPKVWHNIDFDYNKLMPFLKKHFIIRKEIRFGLYDVLTRAYYPASIYPKEPSYNTQYHLCAEKMYFARGKGVFDGCSREICLELIKR